jgi:hypothetical protein
MFSCVLAHASDKAGEGHTEDLLVAEAVDLDVQVVANTGRGVAECRYVLNKCEDVLACVASSICVRGACTQQVKITGCCMEVQQRDESSPPHSTDLLLSKVDSEYSHRAKDVPSYHTVKKLLKKSVSPEDLVLHLGHFDAGTTLLLKFEFLLQLKLSPQTSPAAATAGGHYVIENGIPSKCTSYKLRHASHVPVVNVAPSSSSIPLTNFNWVYTDRTKQVVHISYTIEQELGKMGKKHAAFGIEVAADHPQSACCTCLVQTNSVSLAEGKYDGVMMLSSRLTGDQIVSGGRRGASSKRNYPTELVFLVDCSASMNGFIDSVIATLITAIKSLPTGCFFNIIAFGSTFRQLFHESKEYSNTSMKNAVDFANLLKANLGGTELLPPLKWVFKSARKSDMPCEVFIITDVDQEVKDIPYMLSTLRKYRHHAR